MANKAEKITRNTPPDLDTAHPARRTAYLAFPPMRKDPLLQAAIDRGDVWTDESGTYIAQAAVGPFDSVESCQVELGMVGDEEQIERYLAANPTPDTW